MISITKYFKCTFCSYYKRLNVSEQATAQQIKKSFNQLAKKYHPDVNNQSDQQFIKIKEAYDTLKDPDLRSRYDYERIHGKISERRKFYYYYGDNVQSAAKINAAKRARNLIIMGGMLMLSLAIYFINLYSVPMTEHQIRRQNYILANQNINSSPSAQEKRRIMYQKQMKQKKITSRIITIKVSDGSQQSSKYKNSKRNSIQSIKGIQKETKQCLTLPVSQQYM